MGVINGSYYSFDCSFLFMGFWVPDVTAHFPSYSPG